MSISELKDGIALLPYCSTCEFAVGETPDLMRCGHSVNPDNLAEVLAGKRFEPKEMFYFCIVERKDNSSTGCGFKGQYHQPKQSLPTTSASEATNETSKA